MKTCEILFREDSHEAEYESVEQVDGILYLKIGEEVKEMWNMSNILGVILHKNDEQTVYPEAM